MGGTSALPQDWDKTTTTRAAGKSTAQVFRSSKLQDDLNPANIKMRESRDSDANPESTAIMIKLDVTGSMSRLIDYFMRTGIPNLMKEIYDRKPVTDPAIMFGAIDDIKAGSRAALQATQFESDVQLIDQLANIWIVGGGGGNGSESYTLPWYFAAMKTSIDCFEKRGKKGFLFTIGDDGPPDVVTAAEFEKVFGPGEYQDMTAAQLYDLATRTYHVYHIMVEEGGSHSEGDVKRWTDIIGENLLCLSDHTALAETIVSVLQLVGGADKATVIKSWGGDKSVVVAKALGSLTTSTAAATSAVVEF